MLVKGWSALGFSVQAELGSAQIRECWFDGSRMQVPLVACQMRLVHSMVTTRLYVGG